MRYFYSEKHLKRIKRLERTAFFVAGLTAAAVLIAGISLAVTAKTATALRHEHLAEIIAVSGNVLALFLLLSVAIPARNTRKHAELLPREDEDSYTGIVSVTKDPVRIPRSVPSRRVKIERPGHGGEDQKPETGGHKGSIAEARDDGTAVPEALRVDAVFSGELRKAAEEAKASGKELRLSYAHGFITGYELVNAEEPGETGQFFGEDSRKELENGATEAGKTRSTGRGTGYGTAGILRTVYTNIFLYLALIILSYMFWGWIFTLVTETTKYKKVVIFADVGEIADTALSGVLEEELPEGIRMIPVHPYSFVMFDENALKGADLFIVPESAIAEMTEIAADFSPLFGGGTDGSKAPPEGAEEFGEKLLSCAEERTGAPELLYRAEEGRILGLKIYSSSTGNGAADTMIRYQKPGTAEDCYLVINRDSVHAATLTGSGDNAALEVLLHLYETQAEYLPEDFILGMDVSSLIAEEQSGVRYYDFDGQEQDLLKILADQGIGHIRVRVWNNPYDAEGHGFGGGNCDTENAAEIGKRAAKYGLKLIVDFHYSDFWADPGKQMAPRAWEGMDVEEKSEALYLFTKESLETIKKAGADIAIVQVGNETNGAMAGEKGWYDLGKLMNAGVRAVREVCPKALAALHFTNPEKSGNFAEIAKRLQEFGVEYDVFAASYYPFWHGSLENLSSVLSDIAVRYGKKVMVMETSYPYTEKDTDFSGNTVGSGSGMEKPYPFSEDGQEAAVSDVIRVIAHRTEGGIGAVYWEGAWITVGQESRELNEALWEQYGSGWASSYAAVYDPEDAGKYYGGSAVDNQAFFGPDGKALGSLRLFGKLRGAH